VWGGLTILSTGNFDFSSRKRLRNVKISAFVLDLLYDLVYSSRLNFVFFNFRAHLPGVYTNIAMYIDWIAETLY